MSLYGNITFGREGADEALDEMTMLVRRLGEADVPLLGYQWNPRGEFDRRGSVEDW